MSGEMREQMTAREAADRIEQTLIRDPYQPLHLQKALVMAVTALRGQEEGKGYADGYSQAMTDICTPMRPVVKKWEPSLCPRCGGTFNEECRDGYYRRAYGLKRCPACGQMLEWD